MDFKKLKYITISLIVCVLVLLIGAAVSFILISADRGSVFYKQGMEYYDEGDYQNAYYNFSKIVPASPVFLNGLYRQAKSADNAGDGKTALSKYKILEFLIKDKNITPFVLWRIGNLQYGFNDYKAAKKTFLKLNKKYDDTEYGIAANFMLAKLETGADKKKEYLIKYIECSPDGRFAADVIQYLLDNPDIPMNLVEKLIFGRCLFENSRYKETVQVLERVPINVSWVYLVKSFDKLSSSSNVIKVGKKAFLFDNSAFDETELAEAVSIYIRNDTKNPFLSSKEIYDTAADRRLKGIALYQNSLYSTVQDGLRKRVSFYENYSNSKFASNALFNLFIEHLTNGRNALALKYGKIYLKRFSDRENTPCVLYFTARLKKDAGDVTYKNQINKLISEYPNSYYAYRAYVSFINPNFEDTKFTKITEKTKIDFPDVEDKKAADFFENFALQGDYGAFSDFRIKDQVMGSWIEYKKGNRSMSSVLARDYIQNKRKLPKRENSVWKLAYPIYYDGEINFYSQKRNLDPYLILSLVKEESHFDPNIRSQAGATGLMQVMPSTAGMIAGRHYSPDELKNPDLNIKLGTLYFAHLADIFSGNEPLCVMAYNSGPNAVKKWLDSNKNTDFDIMVEKIPYKETRNYIKKVYTSYWNYLLSYENIEL